MDGRAWRARDRPLRPLIEDRYSPVGQAIDPRRILAHA